MKETFGERFARLRRAKGLRQEDIAERVNISAQAVSKWENDICSPDIQILAELSDILGVSLDELLGREKEQLTTFVPCEERKSIENMVLKIRVDSNDGDKVSVNLPLAIVSICLKSGMAMPQIEGHEALKNIDINQILALVEQGVVGELVSIDSADGDHVRIIVE